MTPVPAGQSVKSCQGLKLTCSREVYLEPNYCRGTVINMELLDVLIVDYLTDL